MAFFISIKTRLCIELRFTFWYFFFSGCSRRGPLVQAHFTGHSGDFVNTVEEKDSINILTVQYMYHGGAVAIGDFNNDKLADIFFSGNMVANRLYLNRGGLKFEDLLGRLIGR
jgi:hypothetical protein